MLVFLSNKGAYRTNVHLWGHLKYLVSNILQTLTDPVKLNSILPCQVKSMPSNGISIHTLSTTPIPIPSGDD